MKLNCMLIDDGYEFGCFRLVDEFWWGWFCFHVFGVVVGDDLDGDEASIALRSSVVQACSAEQSRSFGV